MPIPTSFEVHSGLFCLTLRQTCFYCSAVNAQTAIPSDVGLHFLRRAGRSRASVALVASAIALAFSTVALTQVTALRLTELDKLPQAEAARRLGISLTALKSRMRRGRARLEEMLLQCCEFELSTAGRVLDYWPRRACCVHSSCPEPSTHSHQTTA